VEISKKCSEVKWSQVKGGKLWWESWGYVGVAKWNEGKVMVKNECNSLWQYVFHYCYCSVYDMLNGLLILMFISYSIDCTIDGWGAMLQAGRSRLRLPMRPLIVFGARNPSRRTMAPGFTQLLTEMRTRRFRGVKRGRRVKVDSLTTISEPII
jgi:hypothetical protein